MDLAATFGSSSPLIGVVHLPPLPDAPGYEGSREDVRAAALQDARVLVDGGMDGLLVENYGDAPFHPEDVPATTVAEMTATAREIGIGTDRPFGVNVLRNDAAAALAVAAAAGGDFVRVNVHTGTRATDQGLLEGRAHQTLRLRDAVDDDVAILVDVAVKHSEPVADRDLAEVVEDTVHRGHADGLVVSGPVTGEPADADALASVLDARNDVAPDVPVLVGSGVGPETVADLLARADGAIVGTSLKVDGETTNPVDPKRVDDLVTAVADER
jgi:membrane complex biogenesis BtpA family protein